MCIYMFWNNLKSGCWDLYILLNFFVLQLFSLFSAWTTKAFTRKHCYIGPFSMSHLYLLLRKRKVFLPVKGQSLSTVMVISEYGGNLSCENKMLMQICSWYIFVTPCYHSSKCSWQVTVKHTCTPYLCGFEWSDTVNWHMVEWCTQNLCWDGSSFTWHQLCNNQTVLSVHHFSGY